MAGLNFDARTVDPQQAIEPLPTGWYNMKIIESEMKPTTAGTGSFLELAMEVLDGANAGKKVWDRLNLNNPNPVAVEIGYKTLSAICHATGVIQVQDSAQLHNIPMLVRLVLKPAKGEYDASNAVKGYKQFGSDTQGGAPGGAAPQMNAPRQPDQQPPQNGGQPWQQPGGHQPPQQNGGFQQPDQQPPQQNNGGGGFQQPGQDNNQNQQNNGGGFQQPGNQPDQNQNNQQNGPDQNGGGNPPWGSAPDQNQQQNNGGGFQQQPDQNGGNAANPPWGQQNQ